jgi:hypothetical protein
MKMENKNYISKMKSIQRNKTEMRDGDKVTSGRRERLL